MAITTVGGVAPPASDQSVVTPDASVSAPSAAFSNYRLIARLGSGGMAEVFLALSTNHRSGSSKPLVLKVLRPDLAPEERADFVRMFDDEGRLALRLSHPNIVQTHEVGREGATRFILMEYLDGQSLSALQERAWQAGPDASPDQQLSLEMQLHLLCQVLEALDYAHALTDYDGCRLDIVHRDVSPQNVFVTYYGHAKLMDFGIAKTLESKTKTAAGVVKGKVRYMAPEQVRAGRVDHRADLFSVGVMLWEAIARRNMHGDASSYEVAGRLLNGDLPQLADVAPDVDPHLERVVARALSFDPDGRFAGAGAFREELLEFLDRRSKVSTGELGKRVAGLFERERAAIRRVIWQAMNDGSEPEPMSRVTGALSLAERPRAAAHLAPDTGNGRVTAVARPPSQSLPIALRDTVRAEPLASLVDRSREGQTLVASTAPISTADPSGGGATPPSRKRPALRWLLAVGAGLVALLVAIGGPLVSRLREEPPVVFIDEVRAPVESLPPIRREPVLNPPPSEHVVPNTPFVSPPSERTTPSPDPEPPTQASKREPIIKVWGHDAPTPLPRTSSEVRKLEASNEERKAEVPSNEERKVAAPNEVRKVAAPNEVRKATPPLAGDSSASTPAASTPAASTPSAGHEFPVFHRPRQRRLPDFPRD